LEWKKGSKKLLSKNEDYSNKIIKLLMRSYNFKRIFFNQCKLTIHNPFNHPKTKVKHSNGVGIKVCQEKFRHKTYRISHGRGRGWFYGMEYNTFKWIFSFRFTKPKLLSLIYEVVKIEIGKILLSIFYRLEFSNWTYFAGIGERGFSFPLIQLGFTAPKGWRNSWFSSFKEENYSKNILFLCVRRRYLNLPTKRNSKSKQLFIFPSPFCIFTLDQFGIVNGPFATKLAIFAILKTGEILFTLFVNLGMDIRKRILLQKQWFFSFGKNVNYLEIVICCFSTM